MCDDVGITSPYAPVHERKVNEDLIIYECYLYNLPSPRVCLSWQTAQILVSCRVLWRLIWVSAVCICSLYDTLNFRLFLNFGFLQTAYISAYAVCKQFIKYCYTTVFRTHKLFARI